MINRFNNAMASTNNHANESKRAFSELKTHIHEKFSQQRQLNSNTEPLNNESFALP
jgi:hypothetical protein